MSKKLELLDREGRIHTVVILKPSGKYSRTTKLKFSEARALINNYFGPWRVQK